MKALLYIAVGGAVGSVLRHLLSVWFANFSNSFPLGTLSINAIGCFLMGGAAALILPKLSAGDDLRFLIMTGVLGGFTTYSAFALETLRLWQDGRLTTSALYVVATVFTALGGCLLGYMLAETMFQVA